MQSRLLDRDSLRELLRVCPESIVDSQTFARHLTSRGLLTQWQIDKLLLGKHRGFFLGSYRLLSHLARGGMSSLYVAEHVDSGDIRALKVLPPTKVGESSYLPRFLREARVASQLKHPNIIRVFELQNASENGTETYFMAMELLKGRDLFAEVTENGPLTIRLAVDVIRQAALGLEYSHRANLVHRDVKPGNIFLTDSGTVKVLDLGLAGFLENQQDENLTREFNERILGTADYLAPEQAVDSHIADARADIYSLGCTFYFVLSGRPPFPDGNLAQRILSHQTRDPRDIRDLRTDVPEQLLDLIRRMLVKQRSARIRTAAEVAEELTCWMEHTRFRTEFDEPPVLTSDADADGRRLKRLRVPRKMNTQSETPTAALRSGETPTVNANHASPNTNRYCYSPEFDAFLSLLDREHRMQTVMTSAELTRRRRLLSQLPYNLTPESSENQETLMSVTEKSPVSAQTEKLSTDTSPDADHRNSVPLNSLFRTPATRAANWLRKLSRQ